MSWKKRAELFDQRLAAYETAHAPLPGVARASHRMSFVRQVVESQRRIEYIAAIRERSISPARCDPRSGMFDPILAACRHARAGDVNEASWLTFLSVHGGKHRTLGWSVARALYAGPDSAGLWTWERVSADVSSFRSWLSSEVERWTAAGTLPRFGNHRKYESLSATSPAGTGSTIASYVGWVGNSHNHADRFGADATLSPQQRFDELYASLDEVNRFGRTARFDYLTMSAKLGLAEIEPGTPYLTQATGPLRGARLLFHGSTSAGARARELEPLCVALGRALQVGMQVIEDSLCNWQKSPGAFTAFRG